MTASAQQRRQTDQTIPCEDENENEIKNERSTRSDDGVDYRNSGFMTSVVDQGGCGSCFAFSTCAVLEVFIYLLRFFLFAFLMLLLLMYDFNHSFVLHSLVLFKL